MATVKDGFDTSKFARELGRVFGEYRQYNRRSLPILLEQLGQKVSIDAYIEAAALRPQQVAKIEAVPQALGYAVKRRLATDVIGGRDPFARFKRGSRKGQFKSQSVSSQSARHAINAGHEHVSIADEIRLRKRFAGIYQASGWLGELTKRISGAVRFRTGAIVVKQLSGARLGIHITNPRTNSQEYANATGYLTRAFQRRIADMQVYIQRKLNGDAVAFSRPRPSFPDPRAAVEAAMAGAFKRAA